MHSANLTISQTLGTVRTPAEHRYGFPGASLSFGVRRFGLRIGLEGLAGTGALVQTKAGLAPAAEGWFILNAREACWFWDGRSACFEFEGQYEFQQVGISCGCSRPAFR